MLIEALSPLRVRLPEGEIRLRPGRPVDFPEAWARKLLAKALGKVRLAESRDSDIFQAQYREILRHWWETDAVAVRECRRNPEWPEIRQELTRLQDELGFEKARDLRMKWAEEWHRETGICPHCWESGLYHDPYRGNVE